MAYPQEVLDKIKEKAQTLRRDVVISMGVGNAGHLGGSFSSADIVAALYFHKMNHDPKNPKKPDRDRFLLSKGHAAILQYSALAEAGYFPTDELKHTKEIGSMLQGHPDFQKTPGVEAGTGSLGQGLSIGLGMAIGLKADKIGARVYVICGDGEIAEGQIWEAAMAAGVFKADNLVAIIDRNTLQAQGSIRDRFDTNPLPEKWKAFGWNVIEIDGHDIGEILKALDEAGCANGRPTVIVANTVKGKGAGFAEGVVGFHNGVLTEETYQKALEELKA